MTKVTILRHFLCRFYRASVNLNLIKVECPSLDRSMTSANISMARDDEHLEPWKKFHERVTFISIEGPIENVRSSMLLVKLWV